MHSGTERLLLGLCLLAPDNPNHYHDITETDDAVTVTTINRLIGPLGYMRVDVHWRETSTPEPAPMEEFRS